MDLINCEKCEEEVKGVPFSTLGLELNKHALYKEEFVFPRHADWRGPVGKVAVRSVRLEDGLEYDSDAYNDERFQRRLESLIYFAYDDINEWKNNDRLEVHDYEVICSAPLYERLVQREEKVNDVLAVESAMANTDDPLDLQEGLFQKEDLLDQIKDIDEEIESYIPHLMELDELKETVEHYFDEYVIVCRVDEEDDEIEYDLVHREEIDREEGWIPLEVYREDQKNMALALDECLKDSFVDVLRKCRRKEGKWSQNIEQIVANTMEG